MYKGMLNRYIAGRLVSNFRTWMIAHYRRRFKNDTFNANVGEFGKWQVGFYRDFARFTKEAVINLYRNRQSIAYSWDTLNESQKANVKRAIAEIGLFALLTASAGAMMKYKDKHHNWAYRNLLYVLKRASLETGASMPFNRGFISNIYTMINSPIAATNVINKIMSLTQIGQLNEELQSGPHKGENKYYHNIVHKNLLFYSKF